MNQRASALRVGILFRLGSFWVGWHWSPFNKRLCVNFIPFLTVWIVWPGGNVPGTQSPDPSSETKGAEHG